MNKFLHIALENSEVFNFIGHFTNNYIHTKGSDSTQGSFIQKALFGYET